MCFVVVVVTLFVFSLQTSDIVMFIADDSVVHIVLIYILSRLLLSSSSIGFLYLLE